LNILQNPAVMMLLPTSEAVPTNIKGRRTVLDGVIFANVLNPS
jgi:hypothetical protein